MSPLEGNAPASLAGYCGRCGRSHALPLSATRGEAALAAWFRELSEPDAALAAPLAAAGGKMLAVLVAEDPAGAPVTLRAISGDLLGSPHVEGCVGPVIQHHRFAALERETLAALDDLATRLAAARTEAERTACVQARRAASRRLMRVILETTLLANRRGHLAPLPAVFAGAGGIPSGTADCALPKLLHAANRRGLVIQAVAEAWWGPDHGARRHGQLAPPCTRRCAPILGHLLCDAEPVAALRDAEQADTRPT